MGRGHEQDLALGQDRAAGCRGVGIWEMGLVQEEQALRHVNEPHGHREPRRAGNRLESAVLSLGLKECGAQGSPGTQGCLGRFQEGGIS